MCQNYVGYYRVSTEKQGVAGSASMRSKPPSKAFIASKGADARLVRSFVEVESGKRSDNRPELTRAMEPPRSDRIGKTSRGMSHVRTKAGFLDFRQPWLRPLR